MVYDAQGNLTHTEMTGRKGGLIDAADFKRDAFGRLTAITNAPDGTGYRRVDTCSYYTNGPQAGYLQFFTVDAAGPGPQITSYIYDDLGSRTRCVDARGNDTLYTYNNLEQCVSRQSPVAVRGTTIRYTSYFYYDANDNLIQTSWENRDQNGALGAPSFFNISNSVDILDCVTQVVQTATASHNVTTQYGYDANRNLTLVRSPEAVNGDDTNNVVTCQYDERDLLYLMMHAPGTAGLTTEQYDYDTCRHFIGHHLNGHFDCIYAYDGFERPVTVSDAMGNVTTCGYDAVDNLVSERLDGETNDVAGSAGNIRLAQITYAYDSFNRLLTRTASWFDPASQAAISNGISVTSWTYAPNGQLLTTADALGHTNQYIYDTVGHLAECDEAVALVPDVLRFAYDACDNVTSQTETDNSDLGGNPQSFGITYTYDNLNRCTSEADNTGNTTQYFYDSRNNVVNQLDALGNLSGWSYDGLNRVTLALADMNGDGLLDFATDAGLARTWDDNSRLTSSTDANTNITSYTYDSLDRCIAVTNADTTRRIIVWDAQSDLVSSTDENGTVVTNIYDLLHRCVSRAFTPGTGVAATTTFDLYQYDGMSRCVLASNNVSGDSFSYDSLGDCVSSTQDGLTTACTFDNLGNCLSMTYPSGRMVQYTYDVLNRVSTVSTLRCNFCGEPWLGVATNSYDGPDRLALITRANNVKTRIQYDGQQGTQNATGDFGWQQVSGINHQVAGGAVIDQSTYTYNHAQDKTQRTRISPIPATNSWSYTAIHQLSRAINVKGHRVHLPRLPARHQRQPHRRDEQRRGPTLHA